MLTCCKDSIYVNNFKQNMQKYSPFTFHHHNMWEALDEELFCFSGASGSKRKETSDLSYFIR